MFELSEVSIQLNHKFACEKNPQKQQFLQATQPGMRALFDDASDLKGTLAQDVLSNATIVVPPTHGTIAGCPCTDVSNLNIHSHESTNRQCTADASMQADRWVAGEVTENLCRPCVPVF